MHLPIEVILQIYQFLPIQQILAKTFFLSKFHKSISEQRILDSISAIHVTFVSDQATSLYNLKQDLEFPKAIRLFKTSSDSNSLVFSKNTDSTQDAKDILNIKSKLSLYRLKAIILEDFQYIHTYNSVLGNEEKIGILIHNDPNQIFPFDVEFTNITASKVPLPTSFPIDLATHISPNIHLPITPKIPLIPTPKQKDSSSNAISVWNIYHYNTDYFSDFDHDAEIGVTLQMLKIPRTWFIEAAKRYEPGLADIDTENDSSGWTNDDDWDDWSEDSLPLGTYYEDEAV